MSAGAVTSSIDVAQVVLYMFWVFFAGLIFYLHRENKREGYPLESDGRRGRVKVQGFPSVPPPKTFRRADGSLTQVPSPAGPDTGVTGARVTHRYPGSPIEPVGNPLLAGVGPGSWAARPDVTDKTLTGHARIVPLRTQPAFSVHENDPDPRGMTVRGADDEAGGTVVDLWVDISEAQFRYLELKVAGGRHVLLPINFARVGPRQVKVASILGAQFADVPGTAAPEQVTLLEEEKICAYYGAGTLYATPQRAEPLI